MLKVLVFEYVTGGGMAGESLPPGLLREGDLMLRAVVRDLLALRNVTVTLLRDIRLPHLDAHPRLRVVGLGQVEALDGVWREQVAANDAVWPIAPETGGLLERLCLDVELGGRMLLNTPAAGVRLAASKSATIGRLAQHGLPVVPTWPLGAEKSPPPFVVKQDDGVGCEGASIVEPGDTLPADAHGTWIVQPLVQGESLSLSALFAGGRAAFLTCNRQEVRRCGRGFKLYGCQVNAFPDGDGHWQRLLDGVAGAIPELWGYAGVDLLSTHEGPLLLEVNPRVTTSYAGIRRAVGVNPAELLLHTLRTGALPSTASPGGHMVDISLEHDLAM